MATPPLPTHDFRVRLDPIRTCGRGQGDFTADGATPPGFALFLFLFCLSRVGPSVALDSGRGRTLLCVLGRSLPYNCVCAVPCRFLLSRRNSPSCTFRLPDSCIPSPEACTFLSCSPVSPVPPIPLPGNRQLVLCLWVRFYFSLVLICSQQTGFPECSACLCRCARESHQLPSWQEHNPCAILDAVSLVTPSRDLQK